jgi:DNA helicase IV
VAYAHVDKDSLTTVDGRSIDEATPMQDVDTVDVEDFAVMFELERLRARALGEPELDLGTYHCVIVDEAQEFAPLELSLIGRTVQRGGSIIVAGDAAQQVDTTHAFTGWTNVMYELGSADHERAVLEVNYRCPPEVTELARTLVEVQGAQLGPSRGTGAITRARHENDFQLAAWLTDELATITADDPSASVAVICRGDDTARTLVRTLKHVNQVQLALDGDFRFQPGLTVTSVTEVKGLEFDYVIIPDATPGAYPDTAESRRALYVALTRATHRLVLATPSAWSIPLS